MCVCCGAEYDDASAVVACVNTVVKDGRLAGCGEPVQTVYDADDPAWTTVPAGRLSSPDVCDACGSPLLVKVKGCVRCIACGFKGDCNGW